MDEFGFRTFLVDKETVRLLRLPPAEMTDTELSTLMDWLPEALLPVEVDSLGCQLANSAELERPSWDGFSRGRREERRSLLNLAHLALRHEDLVTAESICSHLLRSSWAIRDRVTAMSLKRHIGHYAKQIVDTLQSP